MCIRDSIYIVEVSNPQRLLEKIKTSNAVERSWIESENVYCTLKNPNEFFDEIPRILVDLHLQLKSFRKSVDTLEEIYKKTAGGS